jgi:hypothetical protein
LVELENLFYDSTNHKLLLAINAEVTVVPKPNQGTNGKGDVILCRAPFLFLFWRSKKEKRKPDYYFVISQPVAKRKKISEV